MNDYIFDITYLMNDFKDNLVFFSAYKDKMFEKNYKQICQGVETGIVVNNSEVTVF